MGSISKTEETHLDSSLYHLESYVSPRSALGTNRSQNRDTSGSKVKLSQRMTGDHRIDPGPHEQLAAEVSLGQSTLYRVDKVSPASTAAESLARHLWPAFVLVSNAPTTPTSESGRVDIFHELHIDRNKKSAGRQPSHRLEQLRAGKVSFQPATSGIGGILTIQHPSADTARLPDSVYRVHTPEPIYESDDGQVSGRPKFLCWKDERGDPRARVEEWEGLRAMSR